MKCSFKINFHKFLLLVLISILFANYSLQIQNDQFEKIKKKFVKNLNEKHLTNYLRQMTLKKNEISDKNFVFITRDDFEVDPEDLNYQFFQSDQTDNDEFKARVFIHKWSQENLGKKSESVKPYSVRTDSEDTHHWRSYVVMLIGKGVNMLKKVCFPSGYSENIGIVVKYGRKCTDKINKLYEFNIMQDSPNTIKDNNERNPNLVEKTKVESIKTTKKKIPNKEQISKVDDEKPVKENKKNIPIAVKSNPDIVNKLKKEKEIIDTNKEKTTDKPAKNINLRVENIKTQNSEIHPISENTIKSSSIKVNKNEVRDRDMHNDQLKLNELGSHEDNLSITHNDDELEDLRF